MKLRTITTPAIALAVALSTVGAVQPALAAVDFDAPAFETVQDQELAKFKKFKFKKFGGKKFKKKKFFYGY